MPEEYLTVNQVAEILQLNPHTVYNWIPLRKIPFVKIGKIVRIPRDQFEEWLETNTHGTRS